MKKLEVCCADIESVWAAKEGGAHRIELCEALELDGLTPSEELIRQTIATGMPVQVLIRVREGNFVYSSEEVETMAASIRLAKELGAHGVVIGALTPEGQIDKPAIARMMEEAEGMSVTFHRAFDVCRDPLQALEEIIALGCHRLLTSGQQHSAFAGIPLLRQLTTQAAGRIIIMPGAGVNPQNAMHILTETGATEIHGSLRRNGHTDARMVRDVVEQF